MSDFYADLATELHAIADDLAGLAGRDLPELYLSIHMQPRVQGDEAKIAAVDALAVALVGAPGQTVQLSGGSYHHRFNGRRGPVSIDGLQQVTPPEQQALQEEIERARAELERLRSSDLDTARTTSTAADDDGSEVT